MWHFSHKTNKALPTGVFLAMLALAGCKPEPQPSPAPPALLNKPEVRLQMETARYCERVLAATRVTVKAVTLPISESNERSIRSLTFSDGPRQVARKGTVVLGTTEVAYSAVMSSKLNTRVAPVSGESCSRVDVDIVLSMLHHTVHVAREFRPGTCAYEKVREHEYQHVDINNAALQEAAVGLQAEMRQHFGTQILYGNPAALHGQLRAELQARWAPRLQALKDEVLLEHEDVDSVDEYASNQTDCDGAISRVIQADPRLQAFVARKR